MIHLSNGQLAVEVNEVGAELWALCREAEPQNSLLWAGGPAWKRRAPVCFPWCGRIRDGYFEEEGRRYEAGLHGFLRDLPHRAAQIDEARAVLLAGSDENTLARFPWRFSAVTTHALEENRVVTAVEVTNTDTRPMPVQLGFHTGLRCPFGTGGSLADYLLRFETAEPAVEAVCEDGFLTGELRPVFSGLETAPVTKGMFDNDSILLTGLKSRWVQLEEWRTGRYLRMDTGGYPNVLLWSAVGVPGFLCIEPWRGSPGRVGGGHTLWERPETARLEPGETFRAVQTLTVGG